MKNFKSEFEAKRMSMWLKIFIASVLISAFCSASALAEEKWQGIDDSVVKKVAKEHGREAWEPFINTDQGDLLLFVFLISGTIGGFAAGYYWRVLMVEKTPNMKQNIRPDNLGSDD